MTNFYTIKDDLKRKRLIIKLCSTSIKKHVKRHKMMYSVKEVCKILGTGEAKVRQLIKDGEIKAYRMGDGGNWRVSKEELDNFYTLNTFYPK